MPVFDAQLLARWTGGTWASQPAAELTGFVMDSRLIKAGQVFVALRTDKRDGHDFLGAALQAGAGAALVSRVVSNIAIPQLVVPDPLAAFQAIAREHRRIFHGRVIGISGSCGKTSTKDLLSLLLGGEQGGVLATEGNLNNHLGVPMTLTRIDPALHRYAVVEAGISEPGEMEVLAAMIEPDLSVITLIGPAHLLELGGLEGVAHAKSRLSAATRPAGVAIFPKQCAEFGAFQALGVKHMVLEPAEVIRPAQPPADTVYFTTTQRGDSTAVAIAYGTPPPLQFSFRRVSQGMAQNAALAICCALWLGVSPELIQRRLASWRPAHWRGELVEDAGRLLYVDCYNANPASMRDALDNFLSITPSSKPRLFVLGCMEELGGDAEVFHKELGRSLLLRAGDKAVLVGAQSIAIRDGLVESGAEEAQTEIRAVADGLSELVSAWPGSVFVKGSRKYRLETVLPGTLAGTGAAH